MWALVRLSMREASTVVFFEHALKSDARRGRSARRERETGGILIKKVGYGARQKYEIRRNSMYIAETICAARGKHFSISGANCQIGIALRSLPQISQISTDIRRSSFHYMCSKGNKSVRSMGDFLRRLGVDSCSF